MGLEINVLHRARAQLLNMLYISTHLSVPHGKSYLEDCYIHIYSYFKKCCRGERRMPIVERRLHD